MQTAVLWWLLVASKLVSFVVHAQLRIIAPSSLADQFKESHGVVYGTTATFGAPYSGEPLLGRLLYAPSRGKDHCAENDYSLDKHTGSTPTGGQMGNDGRELVDVVLVRRGQCTFVTKVRIAQQKGARAVVVVDRETSTLTSKDIQRIIMADDGSGSELKIPSLLISRFDGQKLIDAAKVSELVIELAWDIPRGTHVIVDFWMSSGSQEASEFLQRFKDTAETMKFHLQFVPHYHIFSLPEASNPGRLCMDGGTEFCAPDPDGTGPVTGEDVANEDLRQLCIWSLTARMTPGSDSEKAATYSQQFWDYVVRFADECPGRGGSGDSILGESCSRRVMAKIGVSPDDVQRCARDNRIQLLRDQIKYVAWSPLALRINGWRYSGPLDPETVLKAVCSGYVEPPLECSELLSGFAAQFRWGPGVVSLSAFLWTTLAMMGCMVVLFLLYRQQMTKSVRTVLREEVMLEVQAQMADYTEMTELSNQQQGQRPSLSF